MMAEGWRQPPPQGRLIVAATTTAPPQFLEEGHAAEDAPAVVIAVGVRVDAVRDRLVDDATFSILPIPAPPRPRPAPP